MAARRPSLLLDVMCGKLATYLRMCGYDAAYALDRGAEADDEILAWADQEGREVVTRDVELAERAEHSLLLSSLDVTDQLAELASAGFELSLSEPSRCAKCNGTLVPVEEDEETPDYAPDTDERSVWKCPRERREGGLASRSPRSAASRTVWRCQDCSQHFWRGSHWADVGETLAGIESGN